MYHNLHCSLIQSFFGFRCICGALLTKRHSKFSSRCGVSNTKNEPNTRWTITSALFSCEIFWWVSGLDYLLKCFIKYFTPTTSFSLHHLHDIKSVTNKLKSIVKICSTSSAGDDYVCSGTLGVASLHLCYYQKASEQLHIGVEMETNLRMQESVGTIGYYADLPKADLQFRGKSVYFLYPTTLAFIQLFLNKLK